jgi:hypothetical protein
LAVMPSGWQMQVRPDMMTLTTDALIWCYTLGAAPI